MAITEKAIGVIANIGIDVAKEHFKNKRLEAKAKERLSEYLTRQEKYHFDCSLEEEIDFEGLAEYIHNDLIDDVKIRLFGRKQERGIAREAIADKAACYAQAKTKLSKERAKHLAVTAVDILRGFFRSKIDYSTLFAAAEIEDTVIDEMSEQHKKQDHKIDDLAKSVQDNSLLSIDKNVSLANSGKIDAVEKNVAAFFAGLGTTNLSITPNSPSNVDALNYRHFLKKATSANSIELKDLENNATFISAKVNLVPHNFENLDCEIEFLEKIVAIENHFHISLTIPEEIEISDHQVINRLYSMIRDGKYCGSCSGFTMSFNLTEELRQSIRTIGETACSFSCSLGMHVELFDQKLDFNIIRKIDSMRLDNFEKITKKIDALDNGDPIKVSFVSGNTDPNIHYSDMFYSEETAKNLLKETVS